MTGDVQAVATQVIKIIVITDGVVIHIGGPVLGQRTKVLIAQVPAISDRR